VDHGSITASVRLPQGMRKRLVWTVLALTLAVFAIGLVPQMGYAANSPNLLSAMNPSFEAATDGWDFSGSATTHAASNGWALDANK
jgi:uncharacterized membrane protein SpoIIM required for sporulation